MENGVTAAWIRLGLELAAEAVRRVGMLGNAESARVVARREETVDDSRPGDPEILKIDQEIESFYIEQLAERGIDAVVLSEEAGRVKVEPRCAPEVEYDRPVYFVSDPFDGSLAYTRGITAFWFSALAVYTRPLRPELADSLVSVVVNCIDRSVVFSGSRGAFEGRLDKNGKLVDWHTVAPNGFGKEKLADALLEIYLMKPVSMYPVVEKFKLLFRGVNFILPNSGPSGFCDVASGKVDVYLGYRQPFTDIFTGIAIAERAGCSVTTFEGQRVLFGEDPARRCNIVCSANPKLHGRLLETLKVNGITDSTGQEDD